MKERAEILCWAVHSGFCRRFSTCDSADRGERRRRVRARQANPLRLDAALAANFVKSGDEFVDVRKQEFLSAIPFLNRILRRYKLRPGLPASLPGECVMDPGGVLLMSVMTWVIPACLVYMRTGMFMVALRSSV